MNRTIRLVLLAAVNILLFSPSAHAIPAFARKTGMGCPACHEAWPKLNDFGELFRDRGYRVGTADDDMFDRPLDYLPISFRTTVGYQYQSLTNQAIDGGAGNRTIGSGGFPIPSADLLFGTSLSEHVSVFAVATGFGADGQVSLESAWARINSIGTSWLNLKVGKVELDLPVSEHRSFTLTMPFLIYHFHPTGSTNTFSMGDNQMGVELMGHGEGPGLRYSLTLASGQTLGSAAALSAPTIYGHLTYTYLPRSRILSRIRVGAVGDIGWAPIQFDTLTPMGGMPANVANTGTNNQSFSHLGGELQATLGPLARPFVVSAVWMYGQEDKGFIANATRNGTFHGGFVEADYTPVLAFTAFFRWDQVFTLNQGVEDATMVPANSNNQNAFTIGARYAVWLSAWGSLAAHVEASTQNVENAGASTVITTPLPVRTNTVFAGLDFAL